MRRFHVAVAAAGVLLGAGGAHAALIAGDSFLTTVTSTTGNYVAGNLNAQTATNGTTGYYIGASVGSQAAGWNSGTAAFNAQTGGLTHPAVVNPAGANDGSIVATGNGNNRLQLRDLANLSPTASPDYSFSLLLRESANSYTGTTYGGLGPSRATGQNGIVPTSGIHLGFLNGAIALFYNTGDTALSSEVLVATPSANTTYLAEVDYNVATGKLTPFVYDATGAVVNTPAAQAVTATVASTDLGAFELFITSNFNAGLVGGNPVAVSFDEFRFGTARTDVVQAPEPAAMGLFAAGAIGASLRRRRGAR
jgi:hypothetical protein